jgi:hypothetical protein
VKVCACTNIGKESDAKNIIATVINKKDDSDKNNDVFEMLC